MMGYVDGEEEKMMTFNKQNQEDENRNSSLNAIDLNDDDNDDDLVDDLDDDIPSIAASVTVGSINLL